MSIGRVSAELLKFFLSQVRSLNASLWEKLGLWDSKARGSSAPRPISASAPPPRAQRSPESVEVRNVSIGRVSAELLKISLPRVSLSVPPNASLWEKIRGLLAFPCGGSPASAPCRIDDLPPGQRRGTLHLPPVRSRCPDHRRSGSCGGPSETPEGQCNSSCSCSRGCRRSLPCCLGQSCTFRGGRGRTAGPFSSSLDWCQPWKSRV